MTMTSIGDLARSLALRSRSAALKQANDRLTTELSSGRVADTAKLLGGDLSLISDMDAHLNRLEGYKVATSETALFADAMQTSLETIQNANSNLMDVIFPATETGASTALNQSSLHARSALDTALSALNVRAGGRSIFAGIATDAAAVGDGDALLAALKSVLSGLSSSSEIVEAARDWFDDAAGFRSEFYAGSDTSMAPVQVSDDERASLVTRADDPVFRATLRDLSLAALANDPDLGLDQQEQTNLLNSARDGILNDQNLLTNLRAEIGQTQSRLEETAARNAAARSGIETARHDLLAADPYDTASQLQDVQFQLESLYTVTVRSAQLSLVNFLK